MENFAESDISNSLPLYEEERPSTSSGNRATMNIDWAEEMDGIIEPNNNANNRDVSPQNENESVGLPREIIFKKIKRMFMGKSSKECTICFNPYNRGELIRRLPCKHIFHEGCVIPWLAKNNRCPNCRFDLKEFFSDTENKEN